VTVYLLRKNKGRIYKSEQCFAALAEEQGLGALALEHDASGAPQVLMPAGMPGMSVSISDTKNYWACALSDAPLGIDIEEERNVKPNIARMLHKKEQEYISALEPGSSEWKGEFLAIWTRKESYMKYCGTGMRIGFDSFSVISEDLSYADTAAAKDHPLGYLMGFEAFGLTGAVCSSSPVGDVDVLTFEYEGTMPKPALEKATDLLADADYISAALSKKLQALGYSRDESDAAVEELRERRYLDDARVCASYVRRAAAAGKGTARIRTELLQKGALKADIDKALAEYTEEDGTGEAERARAAVSGMRCENEKDAARIGRKLASLGYPPHIIYDILGELRRNERA